ncbi:hypothetical protein VKT23_002450 [Stygiomarasmius scandens]|uniref:Uncharacterized protein n=1 Tax=Marasmiellus scandens TaxID=2682957 RepID=A0ABR1K5P0_9AGAR
MLGVLLLVLLAASSHAIRVLNITTLGRDPPTVNRLNGESYQQDPLVTFNGYQYAAFWSPDIANVSVRHAHIARRLLPEGDWQGFEFMDYNQTEDDGHDTISLGISRGDGSLHLIFDQHDNPLHYRASIPGVASNPTNVVFTSELFGPIVNFLPGLESLDKSTHFINITYPRFLAMPTISPDSADLLLEMRVGRSGLGDDWLYHYTPGKNWTLVGKYLEGVNNNAYINGLDFDHMGNLHTTWTYRDFINDTGQDVAVQAGPNGPENNHDLNFAYSSDLGFTWHNNWGQLIAEMGVNTSTENPDIPIVPVSAGITMFGIPKFGGILNQEAQTVDGEGRVHVLNRENTTGIEQWYHYWRDTNINWTRTPLPLSLSARSINNITNTPTVIGKRGKLVSPPGTDTLLAILPDNAPNSTGLSILKSTAAARFRDWEVSWEIAEGCGWEPLFDRYRLDARIGDGVLSLLVVNGSDVNVLDLEI